MITKEEFNKVWSESTKEDILNQFYYDHIELQKANEELSKCTRKHWQQKCAEHLIQEKLYKSRIDKAVEYINENKHLSIFADCREPEEDWNYDLECSANDLLNILQNGSDDNG